MMTVTIVLSIAMIVELCLGSFSWAGMLYKLPTAIILLLPALFLAIEARKRRNQEIEFRDFEIKIANIDPYLKNIDFVESEREASEREDISTDSKTTARDIKIELAREFFSKREINKDTENIVIPKDMIEVLDKILSIVDKKNK